MTRAGGSGPHRPDWVAPEFPIRPSPASHDHPGPWRHDMIRPGIRTVRFLLSLDVALAATARRP